MNIKEEYELYLNNIYKNDYIVPEAMNYSFLANSKRIRSLLLFALLQDYNLDYHQGFAAASAIEIMHSYSLIHDDLPAFDNDDYRRGKLSCHKYYDETTAILAGDALLTDCFKQITDSDYSDKVKVKLISLLSQYGGYQGMIKGQCFDMKYENEDINVDQYLQMIDLKTGKLLTLPLLFACIIADKSNEFTNFEKIGQLIGRVFQIQDDLLDVLSNKEETGKSSSDQINHKNTYVQLTSIEESQDKVDKLFDKLYSFLENYPHLLELIKSLEKRKW